MDVIAMHQAGITNCVAPLGTALTEAAGAAAEALRRQGGAAVRQRRRRAEGDGPRHRAAGVAGPARPGRRCPGREGPRRPRPAGGAWMSCRTCWSKPQDSFPYSLGKALGVDMTGRAPRGREEMRDLLFPFIAAAASPMRKDGYLALLADNLGVDVRAVRQDFTAWLAIEAAGCRPEGAERARAQRQGRGARRGSAGSAVTARPVPDARGCRASGAVSRRAERRDWRSADLDDDRAARLYVALEEAFRAEEEGFESLCARIDDPGAPGPRDPQGRQRRVRHEPGADGGGRGAPDPPAGAAEEDGAGERRAAETGKGNGVIPRGSGSFWRRRCIWTASSKD